MGSCPLRAACPSQCRCACHQQRPGLVLVWVPESLVSRGSHLNEASDSSDDSDVFHGVLSINDEPDEGKWGALRNKMAPGASYPVRRRSQRYERCTRGEEADGVFSDKDRNSVILTSYRSTSECALNGEMAGSSAHVFSQSTLGIRNKEDAGNSTPEDLHSEVPVPNTTSRDGPLSRTDQSNKQTTSDPCLVNEVSPTGEPALPRSEPPPLRNHKSKTETRSATAATTTELDCASGEALRPQTLPLNIAPAPEPPNPNAPTLRDQPDSRAMIRKPARRSKLPPVSTNGFGDVSLFPPPSAPTKPPRGAAPPPPPAPPPFERKGSLKRNPEVTVKEKTGSLTSLSTDGSNQGKVQSAPTENNSLDGPQEDSASRLQKVRSPQSIDWESHLRDEPLYQTYRQIVIKKEIRRQTAPRNSSFTSYDSTLDSPLSSGGSPRLGRRSAAQHNTLWQELPAVKESGVLEGMSNEQKKMQESMFEVLTSEASYLRSLNVLTEHFLGSRELLDAIIIRERKILFSNILKVKEVSERFLVDLEARVDDSILITDVCDIIHLHAVSHFSVYIDYVRNQLYQEKTYSELMERNPQFHAAICRLQELPQCQRLPFMSFLLLPFQRITRIKMLIENILKRTDEGSEKEQNATKALDAVTKIIEECNREVGRMKQTEELIHIAQKIEFDKIKAIPIISRSRFLEKQGELNEVHQKGSLFGIKPTKLTPVYLFLFNDYLLITQRRSSDKHLVLDYAHRSLVQLQSCPTMENGFFLTLLENHQGKTCDRLFKASNQSDLHRWVAAFPSQKDDGFSDSDTIYEDWDCPQVHCIEPYIPVQTDELSLEPADIINVLRKSPEGWYEGIRLSDGKKGWFPASRVLEITNEHVRRRNLRERYRVLQAARHIQLNRPSEHKKKCSSA
ncbi:rho guanine nucleotide exchange factor 15-like [Spea bombifrons]|uniref:rho guanine nucleotide exchange factor 15-like n=1 Tax=Spea bombifrons TaxID=233779 RepID=UPI00234C006C|nr:rho guanine nucleotide exchange factor 15-like [Spea bombifrons]